MDSLREFDKRNVLFKVFLILISVVLFLVFAYFSAGLRWFSSFNLFINLVGAIFAFFIGLLALVRFYTKKSSLNYLFLGLGFLVVSVVEVAQILVSMGSFADLFAVSAATEAFPVTEVVSRVFLSIIMFLSWLLMREEYRERRVSERLAFVGVAVGISATVVLVSLYTQLFAGMQEYMFAIIGQTLALLIYILALAGFGRSRGFCCRNFDFWVVFSLVFSIISQIFFLPYLNLEYDLALNLATLAKFISYVLLLFGFLHSVYEMYKREEEIQRELAKKNVILNETKKKVEESYMLLRQEKWKLTKEKESDDGIMRDILSND